MNLEKSRALVDQLWAETIQPRLCEYIRIPAKSPHFDAAWQQNGYLDEAIALTRDWCDTLGVAGYRSQVLQLPGRTPLLLITVDGTAPGRVLFYGHVDKQPEMTGWDSDKGPWQPVIQDDRLYGRGGADDGYAAFAALAAIKTLQDQQLPHPDCVLLIESCEESGSYDLPAYVAALAGQIGVPDLVIALDSGCGNYDQLWANTSLRGVVNATLTIQVLSEGIHSGDAGGVVPSSFRILRQLLDRLEDCHTGALLPEWLQAPIPDHCVAEAQRAAEALGHPIFTQYPTTPALRPMHPDPAEQLLNRAWRPSLSITGADGLPPTADAGNVLRPATAVKLSLRLPPTIDAERAAGQLRALLTDDPPYKARLGFTAGQVNTGWAAPAMASWLGEALNAASKAFFGAPAMTMGEGVTIPFMHLLGEQFPQAQFLVAGVLGPNSNAHGPNEFLHLPAARKLTASLALVLYRRGQQAADEQHPGD